VPGVTDPVPIHLHPAAPLAERVLLPGDPHRALAVAQAVLEAPKMFNHHRGLWGYTGTARDGEPLTVQATGMGGPSAAIVVEELIDLGARTLLRIGTCGALRDGFELGELVAGEEVLATDGTSAALGAGPRLAPSAALLEALVADGARPATVLTTDLFYDPHGGSLDRWLAAGADVVEMEAAALLAIADRRGVAAAIVLAVTDLLGGAERERRRIEREGLERVGLQLGEAGWAALAAVAATS
jgi:uridine phosphorylase